MGQNAALIGGIVGAAIGFFTPLGPVVGWAIGSAIGATFAPTEKVQGQLLTDLRITGTDYGQAIPYVQAHPRIAGQIWWASDRRPVPTVTESGGKGGGGGTETTTYTYDVDLLIGLTDNEICGVSRIWDNGKLVWTNLDISTAASRAASLGTDLWERMTVYFGDATQLSDPTYEAAVGTANAPAYRHRAYVFIQGLHLGASGQMRNFTFEISTKCSVELVQTSGKFTTSTVSPFITSWITTPDAADIEVGSQDFTIEFWLYINSSGMEKGLVTKRTEAATYAAFAVRMQSTNILIYLSSNGTAADLANGVNGGTLTTNGWTHVALVRDGGSVYAFCDGVKSVITTSLGTTSLHNNSEALAIGGDVVDGSSVVWIDEFRFKMGTALYTSNFTPPTAQFVLQDDDVALLHFFGDDESTLFTDETGRAWSSAGSTAGAAHIDSEHFKFAGNEILTTFDEDLDDVVSRLCLRSGLTSGQFDVAALSSITRQVRALAIAQIAPTRQALELLMTSYYFEATVSDKIYYRPRGGAAVATIPYLDLGAVHGGATERDGNIEPFALKFNSDIEIPAQIVLSYINVDDDYQTGTEMSDRLESAVDHSIAPVTMALGLIATEAKANANTMLWDQIASQGSAPIALLGDYARLEPTDVINGLDVNGDSHRCRIVRRADSWPLLELEIVLDDASVLQNLGITSLDYTPSLIVEAATDTLMELMDIPIGRDADNDPGFYVAAKGATTPWSGAAILKSNDDIEYQSVATVAESAVFGTCSTTLGNWTGPHVFDEVNNVTVNVGAGTLASSTRAAVVADETVNAILIGTEVIQFTTATLGAAGIYTLTSLLRGARGTEWAMTGHAASERCVLLRTAGLRRVEMQTNELGVSKYYKGVTLGRRQSTATAETFTDNGIGLKPFSPNDLRAFQDVGTGDITLTWQRRSRLATRGISTLGQSVPLGEDTEAYEIDILPIGSPSSVVRTISATSTAAVYTSAQQSSDGLTHGSIIYRVFMLSAEVGRGYQLEQAA